MNKTPYNPIVFDLTDIFAFILKKAMIILLICIIGAVLGFGYNFFTARSEKVLEEYGRELEEYNSTLSNTKSLLDVLKNKKNSLMTAMNEDPVLDFYNSESIYVSKVSFFISSEDDVVISESGNMIYPNQEQMKVYFDALNLSEILHSNIKNTYLRRLIVFSAQGNNIVITAYSNSKSEAASWVDAVYIKLSSYATEDRGWTVIGRDNNTESYFGQDITDLVNEYYDSLSELEKSISTQEKEIKRLASSAPSPSHALRYSVIGFLAGGVLSVMLLIVLFVKKDPVTKSFIAEKKIGEPFLGAMFAQNGVFDRIARNVIGERRFFSKDAAADFFRKNIGNSILKDNTIKSVSIVCSCNGSMVEKKADSFALILSELGYKTSIVLDAPVNPDSSDIVNGADAVLLLEQQWISQWRLVDASMDITKRFGKKIVGFILI